MSKDENPVQNYIRPSEQTFVGPSGIAYTLRETNGDDDAILSNAGGAKDGSNFNKWIAAVVTAVSGTKHRMTEKEASQIPIRDRSAILFASRIFSLGPIVKFGHTCSRKTCGFSSLDDHPYEEDLNQFFWDFKNPRPSLGEPGYYATLMPAYPVQPIVNPIEKTLSSGKQIRLKYLDGEGESIFLEVAQEDLNKNYELLSRKLEAKLEGDNWTTVQNFKPFTSRDMLELRKIVKTYDEPWDAICSIPCPKCHNVDQVNLLGVTDFFFPTEI